MPLALPLGLLLALSVAPARAQSTEAPSQPAASAAANGWEGAIGFIVNHQPSYSGSGDMVNKPELGFYLRKGRFSITNASVFVNRRRDDVQRGAAADLLRSETMHLNLAVRLDNGRREAASERLTGMGDVRRTLRGRLSLTWMPAPRWRVGLGLSPDLLNRGGGTVVDLGLSHEYPLGPRSTLTLGTSLNWYDSRRMQSHFGVTAAQSQATGLPEYHPGAGLGNWGVGMGWRGDLGERWSAFVSGSHQRVLGPVLDSPLVSGSNGWSVSTGLAWRF